MPENESESAIETQKTERGLFRNGNFLLLWAGEGISLLGDQFYLIALPWLVLQITGDAFAMGTVLAVASVPRALFILVGGAVTDRFSPRNVMLASNLVRMVFVGGLATLVYAGQVKLWMLYGFALGFGLADAFFFPAFSAIVPRLVAESALQRANAIVQGTGQLSLMLGPVMAGGLIALLAGDGEKTDMPGIALALGVDTVTFLASAVALAFIRVRTTGDISKKEKESSVFRSILQGLSTTWRDRTLRPLFVIIAGINLFFIGPFMVGIPVLADSRFPEGAAAFGILMSSFGGGAFVGIILAMLLPAIPPRFLGASLGGLIAPSGLGLIALAYAPTTLSAAVAAALMGGANGYVNILFITWLQRRTPEAMMGRMMSLIMFASLGLVPVSMAVSGALLRQNVTMLFLGAGALMLAIVLLSTLNPNLRRMGLETTLEEHTATSE